MSAKPWELTLDGSKDVKGVQSIALELMLDGSSSLVVRRRLSAKEMTDETFSSLPQEGALQCHGKALFEGALHTVRHHDGAAVELEYRDRLDLLTRTYESEFLKGQKLEDFLKLVSGLVDLRARFFGKFQHDLPGLDLGGRSYFEHVTRMSYEYGFHFTVNSVAKELCFIALGAHRESVSVDKPAIASLSMSRGVGSAYSSAEVMSFDSHKGESKKIDVQASTIYESLSFLKEAGSFGQRNKWALAAGRMESVAGPGREPEKFRQNLCFQLSKQAVGSETLVLTSKERMGLPGDRTELTLGREKALDGKYLVAKVRVRIEAAYPMFETTLVRA